jgi:hypothetical protein
MTKLEPQGLRASDADREAVVSLLGDHHEAGRLTTEEFEQRMTSALTSTTIVELRRLIRDLPHSERRSKANAHTPAPASPRPAPAPRRPLPFARLSGGIRALAVLWTIWATAVAIDVAAWVLSSVSSMELLYFWPAWLIGIGGAALGAVTWSIRMFGFNQDARYRTDAE